MSIDIFERLKAGELVPLTDADYFKVNEVVTRTLALIPLLNAATSTDDIRRILSEIIGEELDKSTTIFAPFYTNTLYSLLIPFAFHARYPMARPVTTCEQNSI